jgi:Flp pilus assembly pilin Flp
MRKLNQEGQGMTEYIILVALIAVAALAAVKYFGGKTKDSFNAAGDSVQNNVTAKINNPDK